MAALTLGSVDAAVRSSFLGTAKSLQCRTTSTSSSRGCSGGPSGLISERSVASTGLSELTSLRSTYNTQSKRHQDTQEVRISKRRLRTRAQAQAASADTIDVPLESEAGVSYESLRDRLAAGQWEEADNETRRLLCVLAGEGAVKRKWVYFSEVQFIPSTDLLTIDALWRAYSNNKFGYSVQRRLWRNADKRWKPLFLKIGWTYGENSTYKKFPLEFTWDLEAPVGHLPLTNALRGTQLIEKLLSHPAFEIFDEGTEMMETTNDLPTFDGAKSAESSEPSSATSTSEKPAQQKNLNILDDVFDSSEYGF